MNTAQKQLSSSIRGYEPVIGVEVHTQLSTATKIFCSCANDNQQVPNTTICEVCTGQPGALPVLNKQVVDSAILIAIATGCRLNYVSEFSRKHYFYPDLPKNFQITQADLPIAEQGLIRVRREDGTVFEVRIKRIHIEEDAGKSMHSHHQDSSFIDLNRAGTPLLEIVSEPDMHSAADVRAYLKELHSIVTATGICSGNMEDGAFRADTNISVRPVGTTTLGTRCELKNINSFKFISDATTYEIERQIDLLEQGEQVVQQTRLWDTRKKITIAMRSKEEAADYRYMPEPDLPLLIIDQQWVESLRSRLPELPAARVDRFMQDYGLSLYEANILAYDNDLARYYEEAAQLAPGRTITHWVLRDLLAYSKERGDAIQTYSSPTHPLRPAQLSALTMLIDQGVISGRIAQELFMTMASTGQKPEDIIIEKGLQQLGSHEELEQIVTTIITENSKQADQYRAGATKLWGFFVGKIMERTKGRANPQMIQEILKKHLN